jgi:hypothetical protein
LRRHDVRFAGRKILATGLKAIRGCGRDSPVLLRLSGVGRKGPFGSEERRGRELGRKGHNDHRGVIAIDAIRPARLVLLVP